MSSQAAAGTSSAPASTTPAPSAAASSTAAASSAPASSGAVPSSSAAAASSGSGNPSASSAASSTSASISASASASGTSSSAPSSSSASSQASSSTSAQIVNATSTSTNPAALTSTTGISKGAIGGIVGGVVGGLVVLILLWTWWRRRKTRGDKVPPPPPRDMAYHSQSIAHGRSGSMATMGHQRRASTYSSLLPPPRAPSTYGNHSRQPSIYTNYPVATPSSGSHEASPPLPPSTSSGSSETPSLSTGGANTPGGAMPMSVPDGSKPVLAPIVTQLSRDNSGSSEEMRAGQRPRHVSSVDRLRGDAHGPNQGNGSDRAPSPASTRPGSEMGTEYNSRANSPHASMSGFPSPGSLPRPSSSRPGYPRPSSMNSLSSSRYLHVGPAGRAPHQGRPIQLEMPRLLGARPDSNGDFFGSTGRIHEGPSLGLDEMGRINRGSRQFNDPGYATAPTRMRVPSNQSLSNRYNQGPSSFDEHNDGRSPSTPRRAPERIADPNTVLQRR
ncbi:hypothetical protein CI109_106890 [Kwoniella shandongensis]|uniref:Uncharacterized protein n=1 Tax=Kwoniella shandongensis TaxID=1734106 RepID=A0A5M6C6B5_9TREE|nr:uncharacterized protein CI109_000854 [Kwoniella shandongensis]KAA5530674.1 hypothetical protein CI109_000854 [Kwoniella shandongensis]